MDFTVRTVGVGSLEAVEVVDPVDDVGGAMGGEREGV